MAVQGCMGAQDPPKSPKMDAPAAMDGHQRAANPTSGAMAHQSPAEKGRLDAKLEALAPLDIGPTEASGAGAHHEPGSAHEHEEHGDDFHVASLQSPQIKPSRDPYTFQKGSPGKLGSPGKGRGHMQRSHSMVAMDKMALTEADDECSSVSSKSSAEEPPAVAGKVYVLEHTTGTVKEDGGAHVGQSAAVGKGMRRSHSVLDVHVITDSEDTEAEEPIILPPERKPGEHLLVVLDMDHTMVGNLVALSDRDNVESNIDWDYWPEGREKGLSVEDIVPYLNRGMLRPGLAAALTTMRDIGATVVVYTHSEYRWAVKVCAAMELVVGFKFVFRLFSRQDCKDGHPSFLAKKSLEYVVERLRDEDGLAWVNVDTAIMFDDDKKALFPGEIGRLVVVPSYDFWEPCQWDEVITEDLLKKNSDDVVDLVRRTVIDWGVAPPSYGTPEGELTEEQREMDEKWSAQRDKKRSILTNYNKLTKLDRLWANVKGALQQVAYFDDDHMEAFPERVRKAIGGGGGGRKGLF